MYTRFFLVLVFGAAAGSALAAGCGTSVDTTPPGASGGAGQSSTGWSTSTSTWQSTAHDGGTGSLPDYVDPGCPDAGPAQTNFECDPYNQDDGQCPPGHGCYIWVDYPVDPCEQEVYGALCIPVGAGQQGDSCASAQDCGAGFCCVVSGEGNQCIQLCPLEGASSCPPGLICEPIDVEGFGGCL